MRSAEGAWAFAEGLFPLLYDDEPMAERFTRWCDVVGAAAPADAALS